MSIRLTFLWIMVAGISIYAWKDWFKSLCGLILIMAMTRDKNMPSRMSGVDGFRRLERGVPLDHLH